MNDIVDHHTRSRMMARIRGKNTKPELALRRAIYARGLRYRLHANNLYGRPDLVLQGHHAVIFVHGCFWHRHESCRYTTIPSTRTDFWAAKFEANIARDSAVRAKLLEAGWRIATVWECALRKPDDVARAADLISNWLLSDQDQVVIGERELHPPHSGNDESTP